MRVAVITDIHANLPALEAASARIESIGVDAHLLRRATWSATGLTPTRSARSSRSAASRRSTATTTTPSAATSRTAAAPTSPRTTASSASSRWTGRSPTPTRAPRRSCATCPSTCASRWASGACAWSTARRARSTSTCSRTSPPRSTSASPPRPSATCWSSATPTSPGCTSTAGCCSSTAARSASPRTATRAPPSRCSRWSAGGVEVTIERVPYDAEAVAREVEAVGLPRRVRRQAGRGGVSADPSLARRLVAEALGTFCLVFAGTGAVVVNAVAGNPLGHGGVAAAFGLVVAIMIFALGHLSGAHINPAVTVGLRGGAPLPARARPCPTSSPRWPARSSPRWRCAVSSGSPAASAQPSPTTSASSARLVLEAGLTAVLMIVILAVATDTRAVGSMAAIAIGATIGLEALVEGPITGASMNPARSLGPGLVAGDLTDLWIYLVGPWPAPSAPCLRVPARRAEPPPTGRSRTRGGGAMTTDDLRPEVLYVCVHNAGRSQMAALLTRSSRRAGHVRSAGSDPADHVNPLVVEAMAEVGLDMSAAFPKLLTDEAVRAADAVITMGCGDACPSTPASGTRTGTSPIPRRRDARRGPRDPRADPRPRRGPARRSGRSDGARALSSSVAR